MPKTSSCQWLLVRPDAVEVNPFWLLRDEWRSVPDGDVDSSTPANLEVFYTEVNVKHGVHSKDNCFNLGQVSNIKVRVPFCSNREKITAETVLRLRNNATESKKKRTER